MFTDKIKAQILEAGFTPSATRPDAYEFAYEDARGRHGWVVSPAATEGFINIEGYFDGNMHRQATLSYDEQLFADITVHHRKTATA